MGKNEKRKPQMQTYSFRQAPFRVFGVPFFEKTGVLERLPQALAAQLDSDRMPFLARRCPGARLCFRTDSPVVGVKSPLLPSRRILACPFIPASRPMCFSAHGPVCRAGPAGGL